MTSADRMQADRMAAMLEPHKSYLSASSHS
jgi:hypothetical protein